MRFAQIETACNCIGKLIPGCACIAYAIHGYKEEVQDYHLMVNGTVLESERDIQMFIGGALAALSREEARKRLYVKQEEP